MAFEAFYLPATEGRRFCLLHRPDPPQPWRGAFVYVHPLAEEMNKSRRMAALQSRALAAAGYAVLQIDLYGCGDSSGDFCAATWDGWVADVELAARWLRQRTQSELWLWGLRSGALLTSAVARRCAEPSRLLLWQPVVSGKTYLTQLLRLRLAGEINELNGAGGKALMAQLREQLANGQGVDIAGYHLSSQLAAGIEAADLLPPLEPVSRGARCVWIELSGRTDAALSPAAAARLADWRAAGIDASGHVLSGVAFWQTAEISECPQLIALTLAAVGASTAAALP